MPRQFYRDELREAAPVWLLSMTYAGRDFYFSTESIEVTDSEGVVRFYSGTLEPLDVEQAFDFLSDSADFPSVSVSVVFPVDVADLIEQGHDLTGSTAELSMYLANTGALYEDRRVFLKGELNTPTYGAAGEAVKFSVEKIAQNDTALFPAASLTVSNRTFSAADDAVMGRLYPFVFGKGGASVDSAGETVKAYATPGYQVGTVTISGSAKRRIMLAGHRVLADTVDLFDTDADIKFSNATVYHAVDSLNQEYAYTYFNISDESSEKDNFAVDWSDGEGAHRGMGVEGTLERGGDLLLCPKT